MKKILGIKAISGDIFYGKINEKGIISGKVDIIEEEMFKSCMYNYIYINKEHFNKNYRESKIDGKKYKIIIKIEEVD